MTEVHPFDRATALARTGDGAYTGSTSSDYANLAGPFGGVTSAALLRAVTEHDALSGDPIALTVNFCGAVADGDFTISATNERTGRHTQHWSLALTQNDEMRATASVVCGKRAPAFSHQPDIAPSAPAPEAVPVAPTNGMMNWLQRYEFRFIHGIPSFNRTPHDEPASSRSLWWVSDLPARPLDYVSLAAISDAFFARILHVRGTIGPLGTVSLTTYFHATPEEIAAQGTTPLLGAAHAKRFNGRFHDQHMDLWGKDGVLLATGTQIVWYKDDA